MKAHEIWQAALGELQLQMTKATFDTWLRDTTLVSYEDGTFVIGVHSGYAKDWLENRLLGIIKRTLIGLVGHAVEVKFVVWSKPRPQLRTPLTAWQRGGPLQEGTSSSSPMLNPKYTFASFIVGNSNRLAHAASLAVAENPGKAYNPLFIYGGVGLGKTHLLHAIGHLCLRHNHRVLYVSSEKFTNDLINAIRTHTTQAFREKYRNIDVLLIDDIQFIAGKESTQEEFFHTFNTLYAANKQIVVSSDRAPKAILTLEERLRSRFEGGLIADIHPPDLETRIAILRSKAEDHPIPIPPEVIDYIAHKIQRNIRELEGALNRVVAYATLMRCPLTLKMAVNVLQDVIAPRTPPSPAKVIEAVARFYELPPEALKGRSRSKKVALPRQVAMYLLREEVGASLPQIGELLGGRDHTTVLHGYEKIRSHIEEDDQLRRAILAIKEILYENGQV